MVLTTNRGCRPFIRQSILLVSILAIMVMTVGCASVNRLREAQDVFNQTAALENELKLASNPLDTSALGSLGSVRSGYASALLSLDKIEDKDEKKLREDGLWGTALTLKALCQWRLGMFPQALKTVEEADKTAAEQIYPRDRAVLAALPGLIKTDQAYAKILKASSFDEENKKVALGEVTELLTGSSGAIDDIQKARVVADEHPVQIYLIQAQLAAYRNFMIALFRLKNHEIVSEKAPEREKANIQLKELNELVKGKPSGPALISYWAKLCNLDMP